MRSLFENRGGGKRLAEVAAADLPFDFHHQTEAYMTTHTSKTHRPRNGSGHPDDGTKTDNPLLSLLSKGDEFWAPYRSFAKAWLATQKDAFAYLDANRKLFDEMREILRKEQDLALEISQKSIDRVAKKGLGHGGAVLDPSEVSAMFEVATAGWQELGEAWMHAQMRSLDAIRSYADAGQKPAAGRRGERSAAAAAA
jgi:hypothetical protein